MIVIPNVNRQIFGVCVSCNLHVHTLAVEHAACNFFFCNVTRLFFKKSTHSDSYLNDHPDTEAALAGVEGLRSDANLKVAIAAGAASKK